MALLLLGLVLVLRVGRERFARPAVVVTVAVLIAGVIYDYSYPGLLWPVAVVRAGSSSSSCSGGVCSTCAPAPGRARGAAGCGNRTAGADRLGRARSQPDPRLLAQRTAARRSGPSAASPGPGWPTSSRPPLARGPEHLAHRGLPVRARRSAARRGARRLRAGRADLRDRHRVRAARAGDGRCGARADRRVLLRQPHAVGVRRVQGADDAGAAVRARRRPGADAASAAIGLAVGRRPRCRRPPSCSSCSRSSRATWRSATHS